MRLNQLEYFVKTVECGGANAAARELSVSQPAISAAIRELEEELGVPLFQRVRQQLILTEEGAAFYRRVGPLLTQLQVTVHEVQAMAGEPQVLRLCLPPMIGMFMTPQILGEFSPAHPDLHLTISEAGTDSIQKMLLNGAADLGIMIGQSPYNVGLEAVALRETRYALFVGRQSSLAGRQMVSFRDLAGEPWSSSIRDCTSMRCSTGSSGRRGCAPISSCRPTRSIPSRTLSGAAWPQPF